MSPATLRTLFLVAVAGFVVWLGYQARAVVTPLLAALLLAYVLDPVVRLLERRGLSRRAASGVVLVAALAALGAAAAFAATRLVQEAGAFKDDVVGEQRVEAASRDEAVRKLVLAGREAPTDVAALEALALRSRLVREATLDGRQVWYLDEDGDGAFAPGYASLGAAKVREFLAGTRWEDALERGLAGLSELGPQVANSAQAVLQGVVEGGSAALSTALSVLSLLFLFPIYLYYSLVHLARVYEVAVGHLPAGQRDRIVEILSKIDVTLSSFFRGRLITMLVKGVLLLALFAAFGVPFSFVLAGFAAVASLVPVVGGIAAAVPPLALSLHDATSGELLALAGGIAAVEIVEGYVLVPALIGRRVGLHPLTVLVCTFVAGDLLGLFGLLLAIPITAVAKILAAEFVLPEVRRRAGRPPGGEPEKPPA